MPRAPRTIHFVSLGCSKNRVDTEVMLGVAEQAGFQHVARPDDAEVIVVNTCGFIDAARQESVTTILEAAQFKQTGRCRKLVVTGCLSQRYSDELLAELPEVDHLLGSSDMLKLAQALSEPAPRSLVGDPADFLMTAGSPRRLSTAPGSAYVKLSEGCDRECAFCTIPAIRGRLRSRPPDDIAAEVRQLVDAGVVEVNLISQDSLAYGRDLRPRPHLAEAVRQVAEVPGVHWVRVHYLYPERLDDELLALWAEHPRVVPYVDLPLQHAATPMLHRMRRGHDGRRVRQLIETLRHRVPELVLRTAFIVGHPGESRAEFDELCDLVRWAEFDHVGVFCYSEEAGTRSAALKPKVAARIAESRARRLLDIQRPISRRKNEQRIGRELTVLVQGPSEEHEWVMIGRHAGQAPDVDGVVYLSEGEVHPGQLRRARITQATDYDLLGVVVDAP